MVRYDVKGKSNLTDAFGIEGEERGEWPGGPTILLGWILRYVERRGARGISPEAGIRYDGKSNQGDSAGPQAPDYVYVWRQLSFQKFDCSREEIESLRG